MTSRQDIPGVSHFGRSWAKRLPKARIRHLLGRPRGYGPAWMLWLVVQVVLFVVELVLLGGWAILVVLLSIGEMILG